MTSLSSPGFPGIPERELDTARLDAFLEEMRSRRADLAVQLHGSGSHGTSWWTCSVRDARSRSTRTARGRSAIAPSSGGPFAAPRSSGSVALGAAVGWPDTGCRLELDLGDIDRREVAQVAPFLVARAVRVHPSRRAFQLAPLARRALCWNRRSPRPRGLGIALTGTIGEAPITAGVASRMLRHPVHDLTGQLSLGGFAALVAGASLVVAATTRERRTSPRP